MDALACAMARPADKAPPGVDAPHREWAVGAADPATVRTAATLDEEIIASYRESGLTP